MKLIWTEPAIIDLENIWDYIAQDSKYYANIFVSKIVVSAKKIVDFPEMGRVVPEFNIKNIREIILKNYRIIYKIKKSQISILTVIHGSRDLTNKKNITWKIE